MVAFRLNGSAMPERFRDAIYRFHAIYRFYSPDEIRAMLERAGFVDTAARSDERRRTTWIVDRLRAGT